MSRIVCWFSCGAASAVATMLTKRAHPDAIVARCALDNEHPDNDRFANELAGRFKWDVIKLRSKKYVDCWDVWESRRFLNSPAVALCSVELKKKVRQDFQRPDDIHVFGFTLDEIDRAERFKQHNPEAVLFPLIEQRITKRRCFEIIQATGIELPAMYRLGYNNANCVGCVKGGAGYWNKIRHDFPEVFKRMSDLEEKIGASVLHDKNGRIPLRTLHPLAGRHDPVDLPECGLFCGMDDAD